MPELLAVDGGGTSTRSVVVDETGRRLGHGRAGSGNPVSAGPETSARSIAASAVEALSAAGVPADRLRLILLAVAGTGSGAHREELRERLAAAGLRAPVVFESDLLAMFAAGTHRTEGYAVVAGTGAAAIRVEGGRQAAVTDGLGWLLGDDGSGFWIGWRVVRAALADLDGRGPATALTPLVLRQLGLGHDLDLDHDLDHDSAGRREAATGRREIAVAAVHQLYADRPVRLAGFARLAFEAAGDAVAAAILREAGEALAGSLRAVAAPDLPGPVVLGGSILAHHPEPAGTVVRALARQGVVPETRVVADGLAGAAVLALRHAGIAVDEAVHRRLTGG